MKRSTWLRLGVAACALLGAIWVMLLFVCPDQVMKASVGPTPVVGVPPDDGVKLNDGVKLTSDGAPLEQPADVGDEAARQQQVAPEPVTDRMTIRGVVVDPEGTPVAGAMVECYGCGAVAGCTDEDGAFLLELQPRQDGEILHVNVRGFVPAFTRAFPGRYSTIELEPGVSIAGQLRLEGANGQEAILAGHELLYGATKDYPSRVRTNGEGGFELVVRPNRSQYISVPFEGKAEWREVIEVEDQALMRDIVVRRATTSIEIVVTDFFSGEHVPGAVIESFRRPVGVTSEEGQFEFLARPGMAYYEFSAVAPGYTRGAATVSISPNEAQAVVGLELALVTAGELFGTVVDQGGRGIEGAEVILLIEKLRLVKPEYKGVDGLQTGAKTTTNELGAFRFEGLGSRHRRLYASVRVRHPSYGESDSDQVVVGTGASVGPIRVELKEGGGSLGRYGRTAGVLRRKSILRSANTWLSGQMIWVAS